MSDTAVRLEKHYSSENSRIRVDYLTDHGQYHAAHFQRELELIYLLNGSADIVLDGYLLSLVQGEFIAIDSNRVYELRCPESFMQISVLVDREFLITHAGPMWVEGQTGIEFRCSRDELTEEQLEPYLEMCELFKELVPHYINEEKGFRLKTESVVLEILYLLVQHFSIPLFPDDVEEKGAERQRIQEILDYIEMHYAEPIGLKELSDQFGLSREYFSRMFHKEIGIPLTQHILRVRIAHFYHDLIATDLPVMELLERHGLHNYKLFAKMFRAIYGKTPREIRKLFQ